ncbi:TetR/AcrR family transcriptional regulator [Specibacter sp. RAF43]|uniref:TetR/AcrR family transcriptional regulator n=1 Tax=Specibacter sp. RAF43 TaxID=3233057 RepID=UPI003F9AAF0A
MRLVDAGLEIFGTTGYAQSQITTICRAAGLTERAFHESFGSREELLATVFNNVATRLFEVSQAALVAAGADTGAGTRSGLAAFIKYLLDDPRVGRIILVEAVGVSAHMEELRLSVFHAFTDIVLHEILMPSRLTVPATPGTEAHEQAELTAVALVGAVNYLLVNALKSRLPLETEALIATAVRLFEAAALNLETP